MMRRHIKRSRNCRSGSTDEQLTIMFSTTAKTNAGPGRNESRAKVTSSGHDYIINTGWDFDMDSYSPLGSLNASKGERRSSLSAARITVWAVSLLGSDLVN